MCADVSPTGKLNNALWLQSLGLALFPLIEGSKLPALDDWPNRATNDRATIERWWRCPITGWEQDNNTGVKCDDLLVIDLDNKDGAVGDESLRFLEILYGDLPDTLTVETASGTSRHLYLRPPAGTRIPNSAGKLGAGIDVRGYHGYVVGPGSEIGGKVYRVARNAPIADAPTWLVELCGQTKGETTPAEQPAAAVAELDTEEALRRGRDYLVNRAPEAVQGDGGDHTTYTVACGLRDFGVSEATALEMLLDDWNDRCSPPWAYEELERKVANAYRYADGPAGGKLAQADFDAEEAEQATSPAAGGTGRISWLEEFNQEYAFVLAGGGHHILWETRDEKGRFKLEHLSETAFHKLHASRTVLPDGAKRPQAMTKMWMESPRRRTYTGICFQPQQEPPEGFYNLWRGFAVRDPGLTADEAAAGCATLLEHLRANVCQGDTELWRWLLNWMAHLVQHPGEKPQVSLVLRGGKGVGKTIVADALGKLLGNHYMLTANRRFLTSNFNVHLESLLLFTLDEAFWSGDKQAEGVLKDLITGGTHLIEPKGKEPYTVDNLLRVIIIGNEDWLVPASADERRFAVLDVGADRRQDRDFFGRIAKELQGEGAAALLAYLRSIKVNRKDVHRAPNTDALADQKKASLDPIHQWLGDSIEEGRLLKLTDGWVDETTTQETFEAFRVYCNARNVRTRLPDQRTFGRMVQSTGVHVSRGRVRKDGERVYVYRWPPLEEARKQWAGWLGYRYSEDKDDA